MSEWLTFLWITRKPNIDLELDCISGKPMKRRFQWYIVGAETLSTFDLRVKYISVRRICLSAHWNQWWQKILKQPLPFGATPLTTLNDSSVGSDTSAQLRIKVPIDYNGMPQIHPQNCLFPFDDHYPNLIHPPSTDPTHHSKRHLDPFSCLPQYTFRTDRATDTHIDRQMG